jgi:hypothetical protein
VAHVLAGSAIAARGAAHETAPFVHQADREPIELGLHGEVDLVGADGLGDALHERLHLLVRVRVAERQHRDAVHHRIERADRRATHALGG